MNSSNLTIQFSISTEFNCQKQIYFKLFSLVKQNCILFKLFKQFSLVKLSLSLSLSLSLCVYSSQFIHLHM